MVTRAPALKVADWEIKDPVVYLSTDSRGIANGPAQGNIGGRLLREFTCTFDVPHRSLDLEPDAWYGHAELIDRSGLVLDSRGPSAEVLFVYPSSPAAEAGIVRGDLTLSSTRYPCAVGPWGQTPTSSRKRTKLDTEPGSVSDLIWSVRLPNSGIRRAARVPSNRIRSQGNGPRGASWGQSKRSLILRYTTSQRNFLCRWRLARLVAVVSRWRKHPNQQSALRLR